MLAWRLFRTLHMSTKEIVEEFPDNQMIKQVMDGKKSMPSDPARRAIYQVQIARLQEKQSSAKSRKAIEIAAITRLNRLLPAIVRKRPKNSAAAAAAEADATATSAGQRADRDHVTQCRRTSSTTRATAAARCQPAETKSPTPEEDAEARRREDRLYADLKVQGLIDLPPTSATRKSWRCRPTSKSCLPTPCAAARGRNLSPA